MRDREHWRCCARCAVRSGHFDAVVLDDVIDGVRGIELLDIAWANAKDPAAAVILLGGAGDVESAMEAGRRGVSAFVVKPIDGLSLLSAVRRAMAQRNQRDEMQARDADRPERLQNRKLVGASRPFMQMLSAIERVAHSVAPVLLIGETGTGKDVLAARIHSIGPRRHRPFVVVNAAAVPAALLDSELFGHVSGSFTGATRMRRGLVAEANGGTLYLDEIADLPLELQGRLLRVLETGAIRAVGSDQERSVDVRFVAATHRDLSIPVSEKRFREDLFFRLNVLAVNVPPLRERREDLPALIEHFFEYSRARNPRSPVTELAAAAQDVSPLALGPEMSGSWRRSSSVWSCSGRGHASKLPTSTCSAMLCRRRRSR